MPNDATFYLISCRKRWIGVVGAKQQCACGIRWGM